MAASSDEVAIVDVGPYGLTAAHCTPAGVETRLLGDVIGSWARRLPAGMLPRSPQTGHHIPDLVLADQELRLTLDDGAERRVDHALLATGYRIDIMRHPRRAPRPTETPCPVGGYPVLGLDFESSVPGMHFPGAAESFGLLMRFVAGTSYAARPVTRVVLAGSRRP